MSSTINLRDESEILMQTVPSKDKPIRILVVDDHPITRFGIVALLQGQQHMEVCAEAGTIQSALQAFMKHRPDITLMDLQLPDGLGIEAIRRIRSIDTTARIIVITTYQGDEDIHQALQAGAKGYLAKGMSHEVLLKAVARVSTGNTFFPSSVTSLLDKRTVEQLSERERDVLRLIIAGKSNREIGEKLLIKEATVKGHVTEILACLGVTDRTQAVVTALRRGLEHL